MLVVRQNVTYTDGDDFLDDGTDGLFQLLEDAGWTLLDEVSAVSGSQDKVYLSAGEDGDQAIYLRITHTSSTDRVHFRTYSLWDPATSTGYNEVGDIIGNTCIQYAAGRANSDGWAAVTKDHAALVLDVDGGTTYNKFYAGLVTPGVAAQHQFNGRLGPPVTGYNIAGVDKLRMASGTDYSNLEADQWLWVVSQSVSEYSSSVELVQVSGYDALTETIFLASNLTKSFPLGSLVSLVPQEVVLWGNSAGQLSAATPYGLHSADDYESTPLTKTSLLDAIGLTTIPETTYGEYPLSPFFLYDAATGQKHATGTLSTFRRAPTGSAVAEDVFTEGLTRAVNFPDGSGFVALQVT